jgi:hypothetical protein
MLMRQKNMNGLEIAGIVVGGLMVVFLLMNAKDIARYIRISTM